MGGAAPPGAGAAASADDAGGARCPHALVGCGRLGERLSRLRGRPEAASEGMDVDGGCHILGCE